MFQLSHKTTQNNVSLYCAEHSLRTNQIQDELIEDTTKNVPMSRMMGDPAGAQLFQNLCRAIGAKKVIEVGVFTGYTTLSLALALPEDGRVVALDIDERCTSIARSYWKKARVEEKIDLRLGEAVQSLQKMIDDGGEDSYDFAFIDCDKQNYDKYYELCLKLVRPNGIIAIDNVLWGLKVLNKNVPNDDSATLAIQALNRKVKNDDRVSATMLTIGDGTTLIFKK